MNQFQPIVDRSQSLGAIWGFFFFPWNAERAATSSVIGSIRRECLDNIIVFNARYSLRVLSSYVDYYHRNALTAFGTLCGDNAFRRDWLREQGKFEPSVSRE